MEFSRQLPAVDFFPARQYRWFKILLGVYLVVYYLQILPDAPVLFPVDRVAIYLGLILSLGLILNFYARIVAALLWLLWAGQVFLNPMIVNVSTPFIGWLLLAIAAIPNPRSNWRIPAEIYWGAWLLFGLNYSLSGCHKLASAAWLAGDAISDLLHHPMARLGWWRDGMLGMPANLLKLMSWGVLAAEISALPLIFWRRTRMLIWSILTLLQVSLLLILDYTLLSLAMLLFHFFLIDWRVLKGLRERDIVKRIETIFVRGYGVGDIKS